MMKFTKTRKVKTPDRGTEKSAGLDFYIPDEAFKDNGGIQAIRPGGSINIPSGIKIKIPKGFVLVAFNKSGIAVKLGLLVGASVVDEDYQGEIHLNVMNPTQDTVYLRQGQKLIQFLLLPAYYSGLTEVPESELYRVETKRGSGGFGSTGLWKKNFK